MQKVHELDTHARDFGPMGFRKVLVHDSADFKILNFNLAEGQVFPVHSHDEDGQLSIVVLQGSGAFLGADGKELPARQGSVLISDIRDPHGVRADEDMRILVTIAPPI